MARASARDDPDDEDELEEEDAPSPRRRSAARPRPRSRPDSARRPVRRWHAGPDDELDEGAPPSTTPRRKPPVYWRARDSLYFEPLVALAIVVVLIAGMYAYTQNWPPVYVIESDSMQHGPNDVLGVINTGDLVLAQKTSFDSIQTYVDGLRSGFMTYGEYGDVILYRPDGGGSTPVIHRAILYLSYNADGTYNASDLAGLPCGSAANAVYATPGTAANCGTTGLTGVIDLYRIGWNPVNVSIDLTSSGLGDHSGFVTMGDNNFAPNPCTSACLGLPDQEEGISTLVEPSWVIGVARGMIPWFGALKLALEGDASQVPPQSWQFLGLTIAGVILLAFGVHYALRAEGIEDPRRKSEEAAAKRDRDEEDEDDDEGERPRSRRFLSSLRPWHTEDEEDDLDAPPAARSTRRSGDKSPSLSSRRGRPKPHVRRTPKPKPKRPARPPHDDDDEDL